MGAKAVTIDWKLVERYLQAGCSGVETAAAIGIHENTLYSRCKKDLKMEFVAFSQQKKASGDVLLKTKQFEAAMKGDKSLLIWLGKQRLNQSDKSESKTEHSGEVHHDLSKLSMDELIKLKEINQKIAT